MKTKMTVAMLCALFAATQPTLALGPPVEIHGVLDLMDPNQAFVRPESFAQLNFPVDESIRYENTNRLVLDFDFADMKHLEITGTDSTNVTIGMIFDDGDLRNVNADIQVRFGFTEMNGDVIGGLFEIPFAYDLVGETQFGATTIDLEPLLLPELPLVFHDVVIVVETSHPDGLFSVDSFSFWDDAFFPAGMVIEPTGEGHIQVGEWIPEPTTLWLLVAGLGLAALRRRHPKKCLATSLLAIAAGVSLLAQNVAAQTVNLPGWRLVWQDEFEAPGVDTSKWKMLTRQNSYNEEKQYYLPQQASIVDGHLRITATDQSIGNKQYRSARLESWQAFGPGRFEARIDLPTGQGMWPAFWLFPNDPRIPWPTGGEIDILENRGSQPELVGSAYHWQAAPGPCCANAHYVFGEYIALDEFGLVNFHQGFHVYAAEWEEDEIRFFVDGELSYTVRETSSRPVFETPKNIILNLAVGGLFGGDPDLSTVFPQVMDVDYVRVWEAVPEPSGCMLLAVCSLALAGHCRRIRT